MCKDDEIIYEEMSREWQPGHDASVAAEPTIGALHVLKVTFLDLLKDQLTLFTKIKPLTPVLP